jgi:HEAT repeat protein
MLHRGFRIGEHFPTWLLLHLLSGPDQPPEKRWAALFALAAKPDPEAFDALVSVLRHDDWEMRRFAIEAVRKHPRVAEAREEIIRLLFDQNDEVRQMACSVCARLGWQESHAGIVTLLRDANPDMRDTAANALAALWQEDDFGALLKLYRADERRAVRIAAAKTLRARVTRLQWRPLFTLWAHDREVRHRVWACELIERFGGRDYLPRLEPLMQDRNTNVRQAARDIAGRLAA